MTIHQHHSQIAIVGGGIAGASIATALARHGVAVHVIESSEHFDDRVRGESMMPWGVAEAETLGLADVLRAAGAHTTPVWRRYSERGDERVIPVGMLLPGVGGTLNLAHPVACQALLDTAARAEARVQRGVRDVTVTTGHRPTVHYRIGDEPHELHAELVIGADGRGSAVRRSAGIGLQRQAADGYVTGLLLDGVTETGHDLLTEHELGLLLLLHQGGGRARCYHVVPTTQRSRYAGPGGPERFLADAAAIPNPAGDAIANARPAGPCGTIAGTDTWTDNPLEDGVVLVGDAAGHNDPTAGCGLSIAMRDARTVATLVADGARRPVDFAGYATERADRMRRLRLVADVVSAACVVEGPDRAERRARFSDAMAAMEAPTFPIVVGMFAGPETIPAPLLEHAPA
jgi:2-polyprenyl-6-methoxyphenol hydroxylase-like FAD-dependent oxidoreductase